ncbi:MAG: aminotransferase class V-fold PLP-dependent enzyme [Celeribacter sp.]|jgi:selenocysteine lyase/cysteine desulfurase
MTQISTPDFAAFRAGFPALRQQTYLSIADKMILHDKVRAAVELHLDRLAHASASRIEHEAEVENARRRFAALVGVSPDTIAITRNVSDGVNALAWARPLADGANMVLTASAEHPNNLYPWLRQQKRGLNLRIVPEGPGGTVDTDAMIAAMDADTVIMTCASASFAPGFRSDLRRLGEACRARGVFFMVDGVQTTGILQHDLSAEPIDAFVTSSSKGLLGAYGFGFLYLAEHWRDRFEPAYLSRPAVYQEGEDHSAMGDYDYMLQPNGRRFEVGSYNLAGAYAVSASLDLLLGLGAAAIEKHALALAAELRDGLSGTAFGALVGQAPDPAQHSHIVTLGTLDAGGHDVSDEPRIMALSAHLKSEQVSHSIRRGQIRMAMHAFNSAADVQRTIEVVDAFASRSAVSGSPQGQAVARGVK